MPLVIPAPPTGFASTPDHASFAITDLDFTVQVSLDNWVPGVTVNLGSQSNIIADIGWSLAVDANGRLVTAWSTDGAVSGHQDQPTTNPTGFVNRSVHTIHTSIDVNNGGGNHVVRFDVDGSLLEQFTRSGTTVINNSGQPLRISNPVLPITGRIYNATLLSGIAGGTVTNPDFAAQAIGTTSFADSTGKTWTITSNASIDTGLVAQQIGREGADPIFSPAASGGDRFTPDPRVFLLYRNTNAATRRVVVVVPGIHYGQALTDVTVTVPATTGEKLIGPLDQRLANTSTGKVDVTYPDGTAGVTVAPIRI